MENLDNTMDNDNGFDLINKINGHKNIKGNRLYGSKPLSVNDKDFRSM